MGSSVPAAKKGLRGYLRSWEGLRPGDGVVIRGATVAPEELAPKGITLGDVVAPQTREGLARMAETPALSCGIVATAAGSGDAAEDAARDQAYALLALVTAAVEADPSAAGSIPPPQGTMVGSSTLTESPADYDGAAGRRALLEFTVTWTSHIA